MNLLSGEELAKQNQALLKGIVPPLSRGLKKTQPAESDSDEIRALQAELRTTLTLERVERACVRSQAEYDPDGQHCIRVLRKMGKWHLYGFVQGGVQFLHPHEALHLIEVNRLELYYNKVIVSLQQAYALLLGKTLSAEAYFVYSHLMRAGYVAEMYDSSKDKRPQNVPFKQAKEEARQYTQCVWYCYNLLESGQLENALNDQSDDDLLKSTAHSMVEIANRIRSSTGETTTPCDLNSPDEDDEDDGGWNVNVVRKRKPRENFRKQQEKQQASKEYRADPFLDCNLFFDRSEQMDRFRNVFHQLQVINICAKHSRNEVDNASIVPLDFDLFFASSTFRKSDPGQPSFRVIVRKSADGPLSKRAVLRTYLRQVYRAQILVIFVSGSMSLQAYVYKFSN